MYEATTDASRKNVGSGIGFSVTKNGKQIYTYKKQIEDTDSNALELLAISHLLRYLESANLKNVLIKTDSLNGVRGLDKYKNGDKNTLYEKHYKYIDIKMKKLNSDIIWIPSKENGVAHRLSREAARGEIGDTPREKKKMKMAIKYKKRVMIKCSFCNEVKPAIKYPRKRKICLHCKNKTETFSLTY